MEIQMGAQYTGQELYHWEIHNHTIPLSINILYRKQCLRDDPVSAQGRDAEKSLEVL